MTIKKIGQLKCGDLIIPYNQFGEYMIFLDPGFRNELWLQFGAKTLGLTIIGTAIFIELDKNSNYAKFFVKSRLGYLDMAYYNNYMFKVLNDYS